MTGVRDAVQAGRIFTDPAAYADLEAWHEVARQLRADDPVHLVEVDGFEPFWAVTRHADVLAVERDPARFLNTERVVLTPAAVETPPLRSIVQMDGEEHTKFRAMTSSWFRPRRLRALQEDIDALAAGFVDALAGRSDPIDVADEVALPFPLRVIMRMLGLPDADEGLMRRLSQELFASEDPEVAREDDGGFVAAAFELMAYFDDVAASRLEHPTDDLSSVLAHATLDGAPIGQLERFSYLVVLIAAGHDTTATALSGGIDVLLHNPDQLAVLRREPHRIDQCVEEIVRWVSPVKGFMRYATEEVVIRDRRIQPGTGVLLSFQSANRDSEVFADADRFNVLRTDVDAHLGFGFGAHFCLGAHLARLELQAFFRHLIPRLVDGEVLDGARRSHSTLVSGFKHLPVRLEIQSADA